MNGKRGYPDGTASAASGRPFNSVRFKVSESHRQAGRSTVCELLSTGRVLYAGTYAPCAIPGHVGPCLKVVFPLPNGNAMVIMRPVLHADGSLTVVSTGKEFGDPGFYFTVHDLDGRIWARYVRTLREGIHVYPAEDGRVRADHELTIFGATFLRLHYRLTRKRDEVVEHLSEPAVS